MEQIPLGFEKQRTSTMWACGAFSFGHLLNLFGIVNYIDQDIKACKTIAHPLTIRFLDGGTSEKNIIKALKRVGFNPVEILEYNEQKAQRRINNLLKNFKPVVLSVDKDSHWIVLAAKIKDRYIVIDSGGKEGNTIVAYNWKQLKKRWINNCDECKGSQVEWCSHCKGYGYCRRCLGTGYNLLTACEWCYGTGGCPYCDGYGWNNYCTVCKATGIRFYGIAANYSSQKPVGNNDLLKNLPRIYTALTKDRVLQEWWGYYLLNISGTFDHKKRSNRQLTAKYFLNRYSNVICDSVKAGANESGYDFRYHLKNIKVISEGYNLTVKKSEVNKRLYEFISVFTRLMLDD